MTSKRIQKSTAVRERVLVGASIIVGLIGIILAYLYWTKMKKKKKKDRPVINPDEGGQQARPKPIDKGVRVVNATPSSFLSLSLKKYNEVISATLGVKLYTPANGYSDLPIAIIHLTNGDDYVHHISRGATNTDFSSPLDCLSHNNRSVSSDLDLEISGSALAIAVAFLSSAYNFDVNAFKSSENASSPNKLIIHCNALLAGYGHTILDIVKKLPDFYKAYNFKTGTKYSNNQKIVEHLESAMNRIYSRVEKKETLSSSYSTSFSEVYVYVPILLEIGGIDSSTISYLKGVKDALDSLSVYRYTGKSHKTKASVDAFWLSIKAVIAGPGKDVLSNDISSFTPGGGFWHNPSSYYGDLSDANKYRTGAYDLSLAETDKGPNLANLKILRSVSVDQLSRVFSNVTNKIKAFLDSLIVNGDQARDLKDALKAIATGKFSEDVGLLSYLYCCYEYLMAIIDPNHVLRPGIIICGSEISNQLASGQSDYSRLLDYELEDLSGISDSFYNSLGQGVYFSFSSLAFSRFCAAFYIANGSYIRVSEDKTVVDEDITIDSQWFSKGLVSDIAIDIVKKVLAYDRTLMKVSKMGYIQFIN